MKKQIWLIRRESAKQSETQTEIKAKLSLRTDKFRDYGEKSQALEYYKIQ